LCLDKGIAKIEYGSPFSWYNDNAGIEGVIMDVLEFNNRLYVASSTGLYQSNDFSKTKNTISFNSVEECNAQIWDLEVLNNTLYIATSAGLFQIASSSNVPELKINDKVIFSLKKSTYFKNILYAGLENGLEVLKILENRIVRYPVKDINGQVRSIEEENKYTVWLGTYGSRTIQLKRNEKLIPYYFESVRKFDEKDNMPGYEVDVFKVSGKIIFSTDYGLKEIKRDSNNNLSFKPFCLFGKQFCDSSHVIYRIKQDLNNHIWMYSTSLSNDNSKGNLGYLVKVRNQYIWNNQVFNRIPEGDIFTFYPQNEKNMWIGGTEGLFLYDLTKPIVNLTGIFYTHINSVIVNDDSLIFNGVFVNKNNTVSVVQPKEYLPELPYRFNNLSFTFSATNYIDENRTLFSYKLDGFDRKWSAWTNEHKKQYTNIPEGTYTFLVKSKDVFGNEGIKASYTFIILPPWYRTSWAFASYLLILLFVIVLIIRVSIYRLKQTNKKLETLVQERTKQILEKNIQLNSALKDIQDSINYAKRLQDSILPQINELKNYFPDAFVFYQPRDIVSGDFYWLYHKNNETILAVADCTGHGVPGAFVSMLGFNLLNQIVYEKKETSPNKILSMLNVGIQRAFHQQNNTNVRDGMDIAIIKVTKNKIIFAGANRPLIYIDKNQNLQVLKPDKKGLDGITGNEIFFNQTEIDKSQVSFCCLFSDGYPDQFGGPKGKKFLLKRFKELLLKNNNLSANAQYMVLKSTFEEWKGNTDQIDDVLVVGVKI
jgi:serine phosphatase RsbU (regulator of sigma subunit)